MPSNCTSWKTNTGYKSIIHYSLSTVYSLLATANRPTRTILPTIICLALHIYLLLRILKTLLNSPLEEKTRLSKIFSPDSLLMNPFRIEGRTTLPQVLPARNRHLEFPLHWFSLNRNLELGAANIALPHAVTLSKGIFVFAFAAQL